MHDHAYPETCLLCAIKHMGAAMIHLGEAMASTDPERLKRRLLEVTFDMDEAGGTHLADKYPELAAEIRTMRKKVEEAALGAREHPEVTREDIEKLIDRLLELREQEAKEEVKCEACSIQRDLMDTAEAFNTLSAEQTAGWRARDGVMALLDMESKKYGIPVPKVHFQENREYCGTTSCTIVAPDPVFALKTAQIFYNPAQYSPRTVFHEWYHYMATVLGAEKIKQLLGPDFAGNADSEAEADKFAYQEIQKAFPSSPVKIVAAMDSGGLESINTMEGSKGQMFQTLEKPELKVMHQSNIFGQLNGIYGWGASITKVPADQLNLAYTPEIIATIVETIDDVVFTPLGSVIWNVVEGAIIHTVAALADVGAEDREYLVQWAAHHVTRVITLANPAAQSTTANAIKSLGAAVASGNLNSVLNQVVNPNMTQQFRSVQRMFSGLKLPGMPAAPGAGHATVGEQYGIPNLGNEGVAQFQ